jgi:hypothetical protein
MGRVEIFLGPAVFSFGLVDMAHPVITPMHDMNGNVPQSGDLVENIVVIAIRRAAGAKEPAIDHVVNEDPGGGSARHIRSFPPEAEGPETQGL